MDSKELIDRNEMKRLKKAMDKEKVYDWAIQFADYINSKVELEHRKYYENALNESVNWYSIALVYTLWFSEETSLFSRSERKSKKIERLNRFMEDIYATIDLFRAKEMTPLDYAKLLSEDGVKIFDKWIEEQE